MDTTKIIARLAEMNPIRLPSPDLGELEALVRQIPGDPFGLYGDAMAEEGLVGGAVVPVSGAVARTLETVSERASSKRRARSDEDNESEGMAAAAKRIRLEDVTVAIPEGYTSCDVFTGKGGRVTQLPLQYDDTVPVLMADHTQITASPVTVDYFPSVNGLYGAPGFFVPPQLSDGSGTFFNAVAGPSYAQGGPVDFAMDSSAMYNPQFPFQDQQAFQRPTYQYSQWTPMTASGPSYTTGGEVNFTLDPTPTHIPQPSSEDLYQQQFYPYPEWNPPMSICPVQNAQAVPSTIDPTMFAPALSRGASNSSWLSDSLPLLTPSSPRSSPAPTRTQAVTLPAQDSAAPASIRREAPTPPVGPPPVAPYKNLGEERPVPEFKPKPRPNATLKARMAKAAAEGKVWEDKWSNGRGRRRKAVVPVVAMVEETIVVVEEVHEVEAQAPFEFFALLPEALIQPEGSGSS